MIFEYWNSKSVLFKSRDKEVRKLLSMKSKGIVAQNKGNNLIIWRMTKILYIFILTEKTNH